MMDTNVGSSEKKKNQAADPVLKQGVKRKGKSERDEYRIFGALFPDRCYHIIVGEFLTGREIGRLDSSITNPAHRQRFHAMLKGVSWESFMEINNWGLEIIEWMTHRQIDFPAGFEVKRLDKGFNPTYESGLARQGQDGSVLIFLEGYSCNDLTLIEQFMTSNMFGAVLAMVKAGYPRDLEQDLACLHPNPEYWPDRGYNKYYLMWWACFYFQVSDLRRLFPLDGWFDWTQSGPLQSPGLALTLIYSQ